MDAISRRLFLKQMSAASALAYSTCAGALDITASQSEIDNGSFSAAESMQAATRAQGGAIGITSQGMLAQANGSRTADSARGVPVQLTDHEGEIRSNSTVWDQDRWRPWLVDLKAEEITHLAGYNADIHGHVRLTSAEDVEPRRTPFGFLDPSDTLTWTVRAPESASYEIAVLYHPGREDNLGSEIIVATARASVAARVRAVRKGGWRGGPQDRPSFKREWLRGELRLKKGLNTLTLSVVPTIRQRELAASDLRTPVVGWPKRSIHIFSIEVVRPAVLSEMQREAPQLKSSTAWMVEGKYGIMFHWVPESYSLNGALPAWKNYAEAVDRFDVEDFANIVAEIGASWVVFTTTHGKYFFPGPLHALDSVLRGRTCNRDLVGEIADALGKRHIRLMLYFHPGPGPAEDPDWAKAAGISPVDDAKNIRIMSSMYREIGQRYGSRLAGWFIDGGDAYYWRNYSFRKLLLDLKAGSPSRVVTFFQWIFPTFSPYAGDFTSDLVDFGAPLAPPFPREWTGKYGPYDGLQPHFNFTLEDEWYPDKPMHRQWPAPIYPTGMLIDYFERMAEAHWPLSINIVITQDVTAGQPFINPASLDQMIAIRKAIRGF